MLLFAIKTGRRFPVTRVPETHRPKLTTNKASHFFTLFLMLAYSISFLKQGKHHRLAVAKL